MSLHPFDSHSVGCCTDPPPPPSPLPSMSRKTWVFELRKYNTPQRASIMYVNLTKPQWHFLQKYNDFFHFKNAMQPNMIWPYMGSGLSQLFDNEWFQRKGDIRVSKYILMCQFLVVTERYLSLYTLSYSMRSVQVVTFLSIYDISMLMFNSHYISPKVIFI